MISPPIKTQLHRPPDAGPYANHVDNVSTPGRIGASVRRDSLLSQHPFQRSPQCDPTCASAPLLFVLLQAAGPTQRWLSAHGHFDSGKGSELLRGEGQVFPPSGKGQRCPQRIFEV